MMIKNPFTNLIKLSALMLLSAGLLYSTTSPAAGIKGKNRTFPYGCRILGYGYDNDLLVIKPVWSQTAQGGDAKQPAPSTSTGSTPTPQQAAAQQTMYLIHNKSSQPLTLKAKKEAGEMYKPDYENVIGPNQWAAFAMDQNQVILTCAHGSNSVNCSTIVEICQYNHAKFSDSTMGSYWVVKSDTLENAVYGAIHIGILLRW